MNWLDLVRQVAPALGTAIGGPLGGVAAAAIAQALGVAAPKGTTSDAIQKTIERAVSAGISPDQLAALKKAELDFTARMQELGIRLEELDAGDRANARAREIAVRDRTPQILALMIISGWFCIQGVLLFHAVPADQRELVLRMLGTLDAAVTGSLWYFLGSSRGSSVKTDAMADAIRGGGTR